MKKSSGINDIIYLFKPYWKYSKSMIILLIIVASVCPALATVGSVLYQQTVVTALSDGRSFQYIFITVIWLSIIIFLPQVVSSVLDICVTTISFEKVERKISRDIYDKARKTDYKYFDTPEFYDNYTWTINERIGKANEARSMIISFFASVTTIVSIIGLIVTQDFIIVLITVAALSISLFIGFKNNKILYKKHEDGAKAYRSLSYINRVFYNKEWAADIKTTNVDDKLMRQYNNSYDDVFGTIKKYRGRIAGYNCLSFALSFFVQVAITMYLCYRVMNGELPIGSFVGLIAASGVLKDRLAQLFNFVQNFNRLSYYAEHLREFEELPSPIENSLDVGDTDCSVPFEVELKNVSFAYPGSSFKLKNINLTIHKGEKIAIVGENGGGKTTLTKLLLRLYDTDSGEILINGRNIKEYDIHKLRENIGIAPQQPNLYAMSFKDNMTLYGGTADDGKIEQICNMFDLNKVLEKTHSTLESNLTREFDENGILLSGGEMQKLALARLYVKKFGLLILDEPSSALDPISEYKLNRIIFNTSSETTTVMIAHRLSNIRDADCIYLIRCGEIAERGTHDELMARGGEYCEMFNKQSEKYNK